MTDTYSADEILARARERQERRSRARRPIDYARMHTVHPKQKAALTRARKSGDRNKIVVACAKAVQEWNEIGAWPDDWSHWQRALDDAFGWNNAAPRLEDLT